MEYVHKNVKHKRAFIIWLAIYPLITLLYLFLGDCLASMAMPLRTLILTAIAVPIMFYFLVPLLNKLFSNWLK